MMDWMELLHHYKLISILIAAVIARVIVFIINKTVHNFFLKTHFIEERKEQTIESMIRSLTKYTVTISFIFFAISQYVSNFGRILAGAGVVGVIVGFGAQSLIKDILSGIFLIYEKQLHKGDFITINNTFNGTVVDIGLRFLKIREWNGKVLTISNGEVKQIHNFNIDQMRVIERVVVSYRENPERVFEILEIACEKINEVHKPCLKLDHSNCAIEPFEVYGMTTINSGYRGIEYTVTGLVDDAYYWDAAKGARRIIAQTLFDYEIKLAEDTMLLRQAENVLLRERN
ncbi:mechanosensitive ion channel family protein [Bacillus sp. ISL-40]|uniref:mechanosensitive ion channel family protein n=1 Tax=unclassified Bacillus (in: firmicutes) TaxID=185979 RepID=UPI001BE622E5|nr:MULTISPECIES: mechanosensitive ion channel family protein [unclassified Bacillus (in: firmicutes)]MBT2696105.1 mechanosensitive ion channel family protein [Bacillus sp. ISL-40]MBT2723291.1 mechanosensitive ion channel family protein [Bacillus sp. ISL-46]MBT2744343.1 mechanosensitive ion channel family protein [Bacillus sp. ISL-77]